MTKRKVKEELKKPDFIMVTIERLTSWSREHLRVCIISLAALVVVGSAVAAYRIYDGRQDDRVQYQLEEGIIAYQEYTVSGSGQALQKAESTFKGVSSSHRKGLDDISNLYLARIYQSQGKTEEARTLYLNVKSRSSDRTLGQLAESALQHFGTAAK